MPTENLDTDVVVIGAGLVGLATAQALLEAGLRSVLVLEAEAGVGQHQSGHNSGVVHSGLYYRPGSLKAQLCTTGREALERLCVAEGIGYERCGKLVVATRPEQINALAELQRRGAANGLAGVKTLDADGIRACEPHVAGVAGLFVPTTGIVDFPGVAKCLAAEIRRSGGEILCNSRVRSIQRPGGGGYRLSLANGTAVTARRLVNCAGLHADRVATWAGAAPTARIVPFRGEYKVLRPERADLVRNLIYPVPDPRFPFLGVHFTRRVDGSIEAGPNAVLAGSRHGYRWRNLSLRDSFDFASSWRFWRMAGRYWKTGFGEMWRSLSPGAFTRALQELVPEITKGDLVPAGAGVRAQALDPDGKIADDFRITRGPNAVHVISAPSPAATACLAIGRYIAAELPG